MQWAQAGLSIEPWYHARHRRNEGACRSRPGKRGQARCAAMRSRQRDLMGCGTAVDEKLFFVIGQAAQCRVGEKVCRMVERTATSSKFAEELSKAKPGEKLALKGKVGPLKKRFAGLTKRGSVADASRWLPQILYTRLDAAAASKGLLP